LGYRLLWYRPDPDQESPHSEFHRSWYRLTRFGIWTPEADRVKAGGVPFPDARRGPDPSEFL
ncbi:MAG: hypothetical protein L3K04_06075, partial [Thermoplasmata archaeon]|nr:hypothetical protein [Thermoplasmata archaeon]